MQRKKQEELETRFFSFLDKILENLSGELPDIECSSKYKFTQNSIKVKQQNLCEKPDLILSEEPEKETLSMTFQNLVIDLKTDEFSFSVKSYLRAIKGASKIKFKNVSIKVNLQYSLVENQDTLNYSMDEYHIKQDLLFKNPQISITIPKNSMTLSILGVEQQSIIDSISDIIQKQLMDNIIEELTSQLTPGTSRHSIDLLNSSEPLRSEIITLIELKDTNTHQISRDSFLKQQLLSVLNLQLLGLLYCGSAEQYRIKKFREIVESHNSVDFNIDKDNGTLRQVVGVLAQISLGMAIFQHNMHVKKVA